MINNWSNENELFSYFLSVSHKENVVEVLEIQLKCFALVFHFDLWSSSANSLEKLDDIFGPGHVLSDGEATVVMVVILPVFNKSGAEFGGKSVHIDLVCQRVLLSIQECNFDILIDF